jgi:Fe-S-cluster containining protein
MMLGENDRMENSRNPGLEVIGLEFDIFNEPVQFRIGVADGQAKLADIVPPARTLSTKLALIVLDRLRKNKEVVPCRKGCSACCSYLVPLSVPEVFRFKEEVSAMPAECNRAVLQSCLDAAKRILDKKLIKNEFAEMNGQAQISRLGRWYADLKLDCPFLSDGLCTLYEQRPTACREHIVTGSALLCEAERMGQSQIVPMPVSVLECLGLLAADLEQSDIEAVMLPFALPWAQGNLERSERRWPAVIMVERFVEILKAAASRSSTQLLCRLS